MAATFKSAGANSASFAVAAASSVLNAAQWALLPAGRLKSLLTKVGGYTAADFFDAFATAGGAVFVSSDGAAADAVWSFPGNVPTLTVAQAGAPNLGSVRISLAYSASA